MLRAEVSIITAAHNAREHIAETIKSVQAQTFSDWEYIIADNGSSDGTNEVIQAYLVDPRIVLVNEPRRGRRFARNAAFSRCRGKYVANIDADDRWRSDKLEKQVALIRSDDSIGLVYTGASLIDRDGRLHGAITPVDISARPLQYLLTVRNPIVHSSVMIRREAFLEDRYQDEMIEDADELIVYLRALLAFPRVALLPEPLTAYRIHAGQGLDTVAVRSYRAEYEKALNNFFALPSVPAQLRRLRGRAFGTMFYLSGSVGIAHRKDLLVSAGYVIRSALLRPQKLHWCLYQLTKLLLVHVPQRLVPRRLRSRRSDQK